MVRKPKDMPCISPHSTSVNTSPLFGDGLGLDSIDALELGLAVKNCYGIVLSSESEEMRQHFTSVATLAAYIQSQQA
ncbi:hypothetical protein ID858_08195 [Xenorhabdus sp. DI]|uniref:phosphopantetheine-binding protein n=1 Tax=Xenorhabdus doucetiae TaxID=351671 RepID=UPI0019CE2A31|nr:hypothetical protein [Xenorhabdus sp. 3]MBD2788488.1 hypothetical protein [Xenorhabdus sp. DI]